MVGIHGVMHLSQISARVRHAKRIGQVGQERCCSLSLGHCLPESDSSAGGLAFLGVCSFGISACLPAFLDCL